MSVPPDGRVFAEEKEKKATKGKVEEAGTKTAGTKNRRNKRSRKQPQLIYSPWTKFCLKGQEANAKQVCFTGKDGRARIGMPVVAAVLIEPDGEPRKILRVTLPLGMSLQPGTRVIVDQGQPMTGPYVICFNNGCMADYEASNELISNLKKGQSLHVQAHQRRRSADQSGAAAHDFAKAYDGPPTDPKVFEEQQKKLQAELQRRAEEARKKLEGQQQVERRSRRHMRTQQEARRSAPLCLFESN